LENRKKVVEVGVLDKDVEKARDDVVKCLRGNDRRPLDCWREVERFREEVRRVEEKWVEKVVR
jgi:MICOS complex subunit MIC19